MAFCANCGTQLGEETHFCPKCGQAAGSSAGGSATPITGTAPAASPAPAAGLPRNVAAALCYVLGFVSGVVFLILEPYDRDPLIRFHALQSIFFSIAAIIISTVIGAIPFLGIFLWYPVWLCLVGVWVALLFMAFTEKKWKLPVIGDWADRQGAAGGQ